jgi:hypothetical protein
MRFANAAPQALPTPIYEYAAQNPCANLISNYKTVLRHGSLSTCRRRKQRQTCASIYSISSGNRAGIIMRLKCLPRERSADSSSKGHYASTSSPMAPEPTMMASSAALPPASITSSPRSKSTAQRSVPNAEQRISVPISTGGRSSYRS